MSSKAQWHSDDTHHHACPAKDHKAAWSSDTYLPNDPDGAVKFAPENELGLNCSSASTACTMFSELMPNVHADAPSGELEHSDSSDDVKSTNSGDASMHLTDHRQPNAHHSSRDHRGWSAKPQQLHHKTS